MAGDNAYAWKKDMEKRAAKWDRHYEKYGDLIKQVADGDYSYAPNPATWVNRPSIGRGEPASYWEVDGSFFRNTFDRYQAAVFDGAGGGYSKGRPDPLAGKNMDPNNTAARGKLFLNALSAVQDLIGAQNQYVIGWSNAGDGFFVSSRYRDGVYIGNESLSIRYEGPDVGRPIIDGIVKGYESLVNPYSDKISRCSEKWRSNPESQYR